MLFWKKKSKLDAVLMENLNLQSEHVTAEELRNRSAISKFFYTKDLVCFDSLSPKNVLWRIKVFDNALSFSSQCANMTNLNVQFDVYLLSAYC